MTLSHCPPLPLPPPPPLQVKAESSAHLKLARYTVIGAIGESVEAALDAGKLGDGARRRLLAGTTVGECQRLVAGLCTAACRLS